MSHFKVGQLVQIADGREGIVRFVGSTSFKEGEWLGLELDEAGGKNDGSVRGERYFDCAPNHGLFIQPAPTILILEQPEARPAAPKVNGKAATSAANSRPSSIVSDTAPPAAAATRPRQSMAGVPGKRAPLAPSTSTTYVRPETRRQSMAPPISTVSRTSRPSIAPKSTSPKKPAATLSSASSRHSLVGSTTNATRPLVRSPGQSSSDSVSIGRVLSPRAPETANRAPRTTTAGPSSAATSRVNPQAVKDKTEYEAKMRAMEKKIVHLREELKEMHQVQEKADRFESIVAKLQSKVQTLLKENNDFKEQAKEWGDRAERLERIEAEHESMMEMADLDREMAEEKAEACKSELDAVRGRLEELELENEILKSENEEWAKDMNPEERSSQGWLQMQRENDRLREALLRLRDWSQEQESALKEDIKALDKDSRELAKVKAEFDTTKTRLLESRAEVEDLKEQLDAALGAETMIEQLTERNMAMSEQIEELRNAVEDFESLRELNDELEINHIEHEKQLQEVIDLKDSALTEQIRRTAQQDDEMNHRDYTISRFRELVTNMQSDLEDMRASKEITETQAQELGSHSRTMMDLNRQLQASATSTKVKTIEVELRKMEAQEASEHLAIVQLFLPEAFHSERDSVLALLRFNRIGFKSRLLHGFMKDRITSPGPHSQSDHLLAACDALDKLTWISAMCERFCNNITSSSLEQFAKFDSSLYELEPVERTLNGYIENLRKDELREQQVADGLQRSIAVMTHLSELHLRSGVESFAEEVLMKTLLMQSNLETTAIALLTMKTEIRNAIPASQDGEDEISTFVEKADSVIMQSRSSKVIVGKVIRSLQELKARNLALTAESESNFEVCQVTTEKLAASLRTLGLSVYNSVHDEGRNSAFALSDLLSIVRDFNVAQYGATDADVFTPLQAKLKALHERLSDIYGVASDLTMTIEFERPQPPWVLRSKELQDSTIVSASAEQEITALKREIHERATALKLRDQTLEESNVKIELLEARMRDVSKKVNKITELEKEIEEVRALERKTAKKMEERALVNVKLEDERDRWMRKAAEMKMRDPSAGDPKNGGVDLVGTSAQMDALKQEIKSLESTVSYLRRETTRIRDEEIAMQNSWLQQPLLSPNSVHTDISNLRQESMHALQKLADLPKTATPLVLEGIRDRSERLKWKPMKTTPQYHLAELEMQWLETWEPGVLAANGKWSNRMNGASAGFVSVR